MWVRARRFSIQKYYQSCCYFHKSAEDLKILKFKKTLTSIMVFEILCFENILYIGHNSCVFYMRNSLFFLHYIIF